MEQIERITNMEEALREAEAAFRGLDEALDRFCAAQEQVRTLDAYYGSPEWFLDLDCDRAGLLPADLRRGVLSEDGIYDLLTDNRELFARIREIGERKEKGGETDGTQSIGD